MVELDTENGKPGYRRARKRSSTPSDERSLGLLGQSPFHNPPSQQNSSWTAWALVIFIMSAVILFHNKVPSFQTQQSIKSTEALTVQQDGSFLEQLLSQQKYHDSNGQLHTKLNEPSFSDKLALGLTDGHDYEQLNSLANNIKLPRKVKVTAIVHLSEYRAREQLQAVLSQTITPTAVWVVCSFGKKQDADKLVTSLRYQHPIQVVVRDDAEWIQIARLADTDYVWLIDSISLVGKGYLEHVWKLSETPDYHQALLGTSAVQLDTANARTTCLRDHSESATSQAVDAINHTWLLRRDWIPALFRGADRLGLRDGSPNTMGFFISHTLKFESDIPSVFIPALAQSDQAVHDLLPAGEQLPCEAMIASLATSRPSQDRSDKKPAVAFVIDSMQDMASLLPLVNAFQQASKTNNAQLHLITSPTGRQYVLGHAQDSEQITLHDILSDKAESSTGRISASWMMGADEAHGLNRQLAQINPHVIITTQETALEASLKVACQPLATTLIRLPRAEVEQVLWMADLPVRALTHWNSVSLQVIVVGNEHVDQLQQVVSSVQQAHYLGDRVHLTLAMISSRSEAIQEYIQDLVWPFGDLTKRYRLLPIGTLPQYFEAWYPTHNDDHAIILPDHAVVSPQFYAWAKYSVLRYRYDPTQVTLSQSLYGVSLYAPKVIDTDPQHRTLFDPETVVGNSLSAYLMQLPSTAGAVMFPKHWRELHDYVTARMADEQSKQLLNIEIPKTRSSKWTYSWRRYLEELVYLRGYVMLYPHANGLSLSSDHLPLSQETVQSFPLATSLFKVPLLTRGSDIPTLSSFQHLPTLDLWGQPASLSDMLTRGHAYQRAVSACEPLPLEEHGYDPSDLLCPIIKKKNA